eukprot:scaffold65897_cov43-Phaeocystis_antarctica.AAC.1
MAAGRARSQPQRGTRRHAPASSARTARGARMTRTDTAWCSGQSVRARECAWVEGVGGGRVRAMVQVWERVEDGGGRGSCNGTRSDIRMCRVYSMGAEGGMRASERVEGLGEGEFWILSNTF